MPTVLYDYSTISDLAASGSADVVGVLETNTTAVGTGNDVTEDNLITYVLPANTLDTNNLGVRITAWGNTLVGANNQTVTLYFGAAVIASIGPAGFGNSTWRFDALVVRTGASTQVSDTIFSSENLGMHLLNAAPNQNDAAPITIKCTGTNGVATVNGVQQFCLIVELVDLTVGGTAGTGVSLQGATPGVQEVGNFHISGVGIVGSLVADNIVETSDGAAATPAYTFTSDTTMGIYASGPNNVSIAIGGALEHSWGTGVYAMGAAQDLILNRRAAATLNLGSTDTAAPVSQNITVQGARGGVDANTNAATLTVQGSLGTGTGTSGDIVFKVGTPQAAGNAQHVAATALTLHNAGTGGTAAPQIHIVDGTAALPSVAFASSVTTGLYRANVTFAGLTAGGVGIGVFLNQADGQVQFGQPGSHWNLHVNTVSSGGKVGVAANSTFGFTAGVGDATAALDTILSRRTTATLNLGAADAAAPVAQTLSVQGARGATDNNTAGTNFTVQGSLGTGNAASGDIVFKTGTPQVAGNTQHVGATTLTLSNAGSAATALPRVTLPSTGQLTFNNDVFVTRRNAAVLNLGAADAAGPVSQALSVQGVVAGTADTAGVPFYIEGSRSTGSGAGGAIVFETTYPGAAAAVQNALSHRSFVASGWTTLTESAATSIATVTFGASSAVSAEFFVTIEANDGTDYQSLTSRVRVSSVRKAAGNTVSSVSLIGTDTLAESTGASTLTSTFTVTEGASAVTLKANAVSSLAQTVLRATFQAIANGPNVAIAQA